MPRFPDPSSGLKRPHPLDVWCPVCERYVARYTGCHHLSIGAEIRRRIAKMKREDEGATGATRRNDDDSQRSLL